MDSWWVCDCTKIALLHAQLRGLIAYCRAPTQLRGRLFSSLAESDLKCKKTSQIKYQDVEGTSLLFYFYLLLIFSAVEYHPEYLQCAALGYPLPKITWESPSGQRLDRQFLKSAAFDQDLQIYKDIYSLHETINSRNFLERYFINKCFIKLIWSITVS